LLGSSLIELLFCVVCFKVFKKKRVDHVGKESAVERIEFGNGRVGTDPVRDGSVDDKGWRYDPFL
jgi:hypothetical protein